MSDIDRAIRDLIVEKVDEAKEEIQESLDDFESRIKILEKDSVDSSFVRDIVKDEMSKWDGGTTKTEEEGPKENSGKKWTKKDDVALARAFHHFTRTSAIFLKRTPEAIECRIHNHLTRFTRFTR